MGVVRYVVNKDKERLNRTAELESEGLFFSLEMPKKKYARGEGIEVTLKVQNVSTQEITLEFETEQHFDFLVQREMNLLFAEVPMNVWRLSSARHPSPQKEIVKVAPGQELTFTDQWNQKDYNQKLVRPGRYVITGFLVAKGRNETLQLRSKTN